MKQRLKCFCAVVGLPCVCCLLPACGLRLFAGSKLSWAYTFPAAYSALCVTGQSGPSDLLAFAVDRNTGSVFAVVTSTNGMSADLVVFKVSADASRAERRAVLCAARFVCVCVCVCESESHSRCVLGVTRGTTPSTTWPL